MAQPSVCETCRFLIFSFWVFHCTDPHIRCRPGHILRKEPRPPGRQRPMTLISNARPLMTRLGPWTTSTNVWRSFTTTGTSTLAPADRETTTRIADYSMYSTFLTASSGSVLFSRSNLLKRKDLCFSCLRIGLIRHRRSIRSSHLSSQVLHDSHRVTLEKLIF
jgi:hypothetical protein